MFVLLRLISRIPSTATAASEPFNHLDRGPPRHGIAVYGAVSLPPAFFRDFCCVRCCGCRYYGPSCLAATTPDELVPVS